MSDGERARGGVARRVEQTAALLYPGVLLAMGYAPVGLIGPLAFAMREEIPVTANILGVTFAVYFVASSLAAALGTPILRRFSGQTITDVGLGLSSMLCAALSLAPGTGYLVAISAIAGIVNGVCTPATNLLIVHTLPPRRHGLGFGIRVAAVPISTTVAAYGAVLVAAGAFGWRAVFIGYGCFGLLVLSIAMIRMPSRRAARVAVVRTRTNRVPGRPGRGLLILCAAGFFGASGTGFYFAFIVDSLISSRLAPAVAAGTVVVVGWVSITTRLGVGVLSDRLPDQVQHLRLIVVLMLVATVGMVGVAFGSGQLVLTLATLAAVGIGMSWGGLLHHASVSLFPEEGPRATSFTQSGNFAGMVLGSLLFGYLANAVSFTAAWLPPIACALASAVLFGVIARYVRRSRAGEGDE